MINKDLYPTPQEVFDTMIFGRNLKNAYILDPSAGFGNLLDYSKVYTNNLYCYEIEDRLQSVLKSKEYKLLGSDFLQSKKENISHITHIVMNPPFSADVKHILHAWNIAPEGCEIIALCNYESINNKYSRSRNELERLINDYGNCENLGSVFSNAERQTNVEVGLVKLYKPVVSKDFDYSIFFTEETEEDQQNGLMSYNEVRAIVNNYVGVLKEFDKIQESLKYINNNSRSTLTLNFSDKQSFTDKETFAKQFQKQAWRELFSKFKMTKYLTSNLMDKVNKFVETQSNVPFTMQNVYVMIDMVFQTRYENLQNALVDAVDNFTRYTHSNRHSVPGWKTNLGHMLNKKIIINNAVDMDFARNMKYGKTSDQITDLIKVMCNLFGVDYNNVQDVRKWITRDHNTNTWYDVEFFRFKFFKKGTLHLEFLDLEQWKKLNASYGKVKGFTLKE